MRLPVRWTAVLLFAVAALGCSDDGDPDSDTGTETGSEIEIDVVAADLAALMCEAQATCECQPEPVAADCTAAILPAVASDVARGHGQGLRYHEECLDLAAARLAGLGCRLDHETVGDEELANLEFTASRCKLLAGADGAGDPCQSVPGNIGPLYLGDSCEQGAMCVEGSCIRLVAEVGEVCAGQARCPPGSACLDPEGTGVPTCQAPPTGEGDRCNPHDSNACGVDLLCSRDSAVCGPAPGVGEPCPEGACVTGSLCDGAICQEVPGDGDPCGFFGCADGLTCDPETVTCTPLPVGGEPCPGSLCAPGWLCGLEAVCVDAPPVMCELPFCRYRFDGLCDEPEGTGLCPDDTDPEDCGVGASAQIAPTDQSS